jgi:signal transduction histidine kinase
LNGINTYKLQKAHFIDRGFPRHFIMIEKLTAEILAAEKNVYGKVIRMMAHEVNNTIGPVNSIIQSTLQSGRYSAPLTHALEIAMERNHNLNAFMRNFADLVRIPLPEKKPIDLIPLVQRTTDLMQSRTGEKKIKFLTEYNARQLLISADTQLMEQALINIIKNAMEAIEDTGTITILSYTHPRQLLIRNTGKGIPREAEENLFSPFYSTKKDGQGIGLTLVREILTSHGFTFSLKTVAPDQTEFSIALS